MRTGFLFAAALVGVALAACSADRPRPVELTSALVAAPARVEPVRLAAGGSEPAAESPSPASGPAGCPEGMVLVSGSYCPDVEHTCLEWMDPPGRYEHFRCAEYKQPATCKSGRVTMRYCIDRTELVEDGKLPRNHTSFHDVSRICAARGKRPCRESEWQFACEGEEMRPYPYGWKRDATACNVDVTKDLGRTGRLVDHRAEPGAFDRCASPFGVMDMSGNLEEWVAADGAGKMGWHQVLKGSWWIPSRHACRSFQIGHGPEYGGGETGGRCCKDAD